MSEHLNELLSAYVDDDVTALERMKVEAHVAQCAVCRADLEGLRRVVRRAAGLDDRPPARDLWPEIAAKISETGTGDVVPLAPRRRRIAFTVPQLAAAAIALIALSIGASRVMLAPGLAARPDTALVTASPEAQLVMSYDGPIGDLQRTLAQRRGRLDTSTVRVIEQSLRVIDGAIRQARRALAKDPNNPYLNNHLQRALDQKLDVLRRAVTLPVVS